MDKDGINLWRLSSWPKSFRQSQTGSKKSRDAVFLNDDGSWRSILYGIYCTVRYLLPVDNTLGEDAVLVAYAISVGRHAQRGHGVQKTGGQPAQTPVS